MYVLDKINVCTVKVQHVKKIKRDKSHVASIILEQRLLFQGNRAVQHMRTFASSPAAAVSAATMARTVVSPRASASNPESSAPAT